MDEEPRDTDQALAEGDLEKTAEEDSDDALIDPENSSDVNINTDILQKDDDLDEFGATDDNADAALDDGDDDVHIDVDIVDIEADDQELGLADEPVVDADDAATDDDPETSERDETIMEEGVVESESESVPVAAESDAVPAFEPTPREEPGAELVSDVAIDAASMPAPSPTSALNQGHAPEGTPLLADPMSESLHTAPSPKPDAATPAETTVQQGIPATAATPITAAEPVKPVPENVQTLRRMLREALSEHTQLSTDGLKVQSKIATLKYGAGHATNLLHRSISDDIGELNRQYASNLNRVTDLYNVFKAKQDTFNSKISRLNKLLDEEDDNAAELRESFKQFKRELCKAAVFNRTGMTISMKKMERLEAMDLEKDRDLESLRLKHIHYRNQLKKQEEAVKQKEQLSEGLHLIDFEQLKIENQTLNEKIEERNDDLHKLKKKVTTTVQVLTHIKEKIEFIEQENETLRNHLTELDKELQGKRDQMTKAKRVRDRLRAALCQ